ncbi:MAG: hypothetical protein ACYS0G_01455 [Planctomycetota bacterium]
MLLALLFVYSSIGSAAPLVRQLRMFEMTEYEWFHFWPFNALIALICVTLVVTTVRRIPLEPINYGVWMIHGGIIILAVSSVVYFGTKVEGDTPVVRRHLKIRLPGEEPASVLVMPGNETHVGPSDNPYRVRIASIDPAWDILSGADQGEQAYSVNVLVQSRERTFIRQLLAGYPQYTEDLIRSDEPGPPWTRAVKALGKSIVDKDLKLGLDYEPQPWFYLSNDMSKSWALYLREVPDDEPPGEWVQRPIEGLPLYNDYVADPGEVWFPDSLDARGPRPLHVEVPPAGESDPLPDATIVIRSYLRYAFMDARRRAGGEVFDPAVWLRIESSDGRGETYELVALDPVRRMEPQGRLVFAWVDSESALEALLEFREPTLKIRVPTTSLDLEVPIRAISARDPALPFEPIEGTEYSYRVQALHDGLQLASGEVISVAAVQIRTPDRSFVRWVSDDPSKTRDLVDSSAPADAHGGPLELDRDLVMEYVPGIGPAPITIVGGPGESDLRLVLTTAGASPRTQAVAVGDLVPLTASLSLRILRYAPNSRLEVKPAIVAPEQRNRDLRARRSMIKAELPTEGPAEAHWLIFHDWPVADEAHSLRRVVFRPTEVELPDGRRVELMFSRQRRKLPSPVVLEDFVMDTHVGGFTGQNLSVLNWTSKIRFDTPDGWSDPLAVSVNNPEEFGGLWYFQAQWDPPDASTGYGGLNLTVLGVGNRHGVNFMLLGCCVTVVGMIYAFYVKPMIKRRRQQLAYARVDHERRAREAAPAEPEVEPLNEPVGTIGEERR